MTTNHFLRVFTLMAFLVLACVVTAVEAQSLVVDGGIQFADGTIQYSALVGYAPVGDTGQKGCWDKNGDGIACSGTGQDGEKQSGSDWPSPRFKDNQDGTVSDTLTGLIWLRDADCFGVREWASALEMANTLMDGICELSDGSLETDWRLPNLRELLSLIDYGQYSPALPMGNVFVDVRNAAYWTSTSAIEAPQNAWVVGLESGFCDSGPKEGLHFYVWPVRGGQ